ncbi:ribonuclease P protein component [Aestuariirhabdus sp. Z084]|uniref:ribonuclease P protein component n=1 Tax=Aestuariirhabdus haliotis TaxID=2918751 RepID=UPI00201B39AD|nr:ribonuclease P protein component [Aestuariirhabdus haliotis]MCL6414236.1 ribonuclease P protein component [Aestuariirhabdus haliotis]MCL6418168.1 ribonuclease P protein component [Aestuariirhabdus haliotis]
MTAAIGNKVGFDRSLRLLKAADYKRVFDGAEFKVSHSNLLILSRRNSYDYPRLGLVIAKKNVRFAVSRNRIKRLIRESFRHHQAELKGLDIVILARKGIDRKDNPEISGLLIKQWQRLQQRSQKSQTLPTP